MFSNTGFDNSMHHGIKDHQFASTHTFTLNRAASDPVCTRESASIPPIIPFNHQENGVPFSDVRGILTNDSEVSNSQADLVNQNQNLGKINSCFSKILKTLTVKIF